MKDFTYLYSLVAYAIEKPFDYVVNMFRDNDIKTSNSFVFGGIAKSKGISYLWYYDFETGPHYYSLKGKECNAEKILDGRVEYFNIRDSYFLYSVFVEYTEEDGTENSQAKHFSELFSYDREILRSKYSSKMNTESVHHKVFLFLGGESIEYVGNLLVFKFKDGTMCIA